MAITSASPFGKNFFTPFISIASVTVSPLKPNSLRNRSVTTFLDMEEGIFGVASNAGIFICATITDGAPA